jgi:hypothetical protein
MRTGLLAPGLAGQAGRRDSGAGGARAGSVLAFQQSAGNRATARLLRGREQPIAIEHVLARQHAVGNRASARLLSRQPPSIRTGQNWDDVAGEVFAPALTAEGEFTGADFQREQEWTRRILGPGASEADARADMLEARIAVAERNRLRGAVAGRNRLGVFVGPEWYFKRTPEPYTEEEYERIIARLRKISVAYPRIVIAPGTIVWRRKRGKQYQMANTAPVVYGGYVVTVIHKSKVNGDLDGYPDQAKKQQEWDAFQAHSPSISFFTVDGVRFALEICGDQSNARARLEHATLDPWGGGARADVALLISHGASSPIVNNTMVRSGGIALHSDSTPQGHTPSYGTSAAYTIQPNVPANRRPRHFFMQGAAHTGDPLDPERLHTGVLAL